MKNLYGKKRYRKITSSLKHQLEGLIQEYDDKDALKLLKQLPY